MLVQSSPFSQEALPSILAVEYKQSFPLSHTETAEGSENRIPTPMRPSMKERLISKNFSSPVARRILAKQNELREAQKENGDANIMALEEAGPDQHATVGITPNSVRVLERKLGEGVQGSVYSSARLLNDSDQTENEALKFSDQPPISSYLTGAPSTRLNVPLQRYELRSGGKIKYCTTHRLGEGDLARFNVTKGPDPIQTYLRIIGNVASGAAFLHAQDIVHRDIKPQNIIVISKEEGGQLGDLDMIHRIKTEPHITRCTPDFAPPSIWDNSVGRQANRWGIQTKADDVFSLGRTLQYGLIKDLFAQYSETKEQARLLMPMTVKLFNDEDAAKKQINSFKSKSKSISVIKMDQIQDPSAPSKVRFIPSIIRVYPSKYDLKQITAEGLNILEPKLTKQEFDALDFAATLAGYMQDESPENRPTMLQIYNRIKVFQAELSSSLPENKPAISLPKRNRDHEVSPPSSEKKRTRLSRKPISVGNLPSKPLSR